MSNMENTDSDTLELVVDSNSKIIMKNTTKICKLENIQKELALPLDRPIDRASLYTGFTKTIIKKIKMKCEGQVDQACGSKNNITRNTVQEAIYSLYINDRILPTSARIINKLDPDCKISTDAMRALLRKFGYTWMKRPEFSYSLLTEKTSVLTEKFNYFQSIQRFKRESRTIYYILEASFDFDNMKIEPFWRAPFYVEKSNDTPKTAFIQAVCIEGTLKAKIISPLNIYRCTEWMKELLPSLKPNSVIVLNNSPHHGLELQPRPNETSTKSDITSWLTANNCTVSMTRAELLTLAYKVRPVVKKYKLDEYIKAAGHEVLRLPDHIYYMTPTYTLVGKANRHYQEHKDSKRKEQMVQDMSDSMKAVSDVPTLEKEHMNCDCILDISQKKDLMVEKLQDQLMCVFANDHVRKQENDFETDYDTSPDSDTE